MRSFKLQLLLKNCTVQYLFFMFYQHALCLVLLLFLCNGAFLLISNKFWDLSLLHWPRYISYPVEWNRAVVAAFILLCSVAAPDVYPGSDFSYPGSRIQSWQDLGSAVKNLSILTPKTEVLSSQIKTGMFIPYPGSGFFVFSHPGGVKKHQIPDPDSGSGSAILLLCSIKWAMINWFIPEKNFPFSTIKTSVSSYHPLAFFTFRKRRCLKSLRTTALPPLSWPRKLQRSMLKPRSSTR